MIKYFTVENFRSIKNENILEFDANLGKNYPYVASPVIGVAGANASGKTCLLQALTFVLWFMQKSFLKLGENEHIPYEPFVTQHNFDTIFHLIFAKKTLFDNQKKWVDYEYKLCLSGNKVIIEELYYYPKARKRIAYIRQKNEVKFGNTLNHLNQEILLNLRKNSSIISFAAQFASQKVARDCQKLRF